MLCVDLIASDGRQFPLEMHMVHVAPTTKELAVVGVMFEEGQYTYHPRSLLYPPVCIILSQIWFDEQTISQVSLPTHFCRIC